MFNERFSASVSPLYAEHATAVRTTLRRRGVPEDELEDLAHVVFRIAQARSERVPKNKSGARRWLLDVARKVTANWHRLYQHFYEVLEPEAIADAIAEPEGMEGHLEMCLDVHTALGKLAPEDQELLWRHAVDGESLQELAPWLGLSKSGAHVRLVEVKRQIRALLQEDPLPAQS
jgi:RNA polymerase sigma factor (sigma-70 family)